MEIWKQTEYKNYEISNTGKIRNKTTKRELKGEISNTGYRRVVISEGDKEFKRAVHILVGKAFVPLTGKNPDGSIINGNPQVNHKDKNKLNNNYENLEWCDAKYNSNYSNKNRKASEITKTKMSESRKGNKNPKARKVLCVEQNKKFDTLTEAKIFCNGTSTSDISKACKGKYKKAFGYHWKYCD